MKLANIRGRAHALEGECAVDLAAVSLGRLPADPMAYVSPSVQQQARDVLAGATPAVSCDYGPEDVGPPIPRPGKILAVALNYRAHAEESHREVPTEPAVFSKLTTSLCGPYDPVEVPEGRSMVDYEAEVVVVVGRTMRGVPAEDVWDHLAGVTVGQDISDREEQRRPPGQFSLAKSYDTFSPTGPVMVTPDELPDRDAITIIGRIDGSEVQRGTTAMLLHTIPDLMAWTCRYVTLEPGDLVFTGTPEGVGFRRQPPLFLQEGMVLETEVPEIGTMRNPVRCIDGRRHGNAGPPADGRAGA